MVKRDDYYKSLFVGSNAEQLSRLGSSINDFVDWADNSETLNLISIEKLKKRGGPAAKERDRLDFLCRGFISKLADQAMKEYDGETR
jgi:hypothetical protein